MFAVKLLLTATEEALAVVASSRLANTTQDTSNHRQRKYEQGPGAWGERCL